MYPCRHSSSSTIPTHDMVSASTTTRGMPRNPTAHLLRGGCVHRSQVAVSQMCEVSLPTTSTWSTGSLTSQCASVPCASSDVLVSAPSRADWNSVACHVVYDGNIISYQAFGCSTQVACSLKTHVSWNHTSLSETCQSALDQRVYLQKRGFSMFSAQESVSMPFLHLYFPAT